MKLLTIGMSPYNTTSVGRLHAEILRHVLFEGHSVISLAWAHDISYHIPESDGQYYYRFDALPPDAPNDQPSSPIEYKIPIMPLRKGLSDPVPIYEAISQLEPDVVITIGDLAEAAFMKAVKTFVSKPFKWLAVLAQAQYPISEELEELADYMDGVLCSSFSAQEAIRKFFNKPNLEARFVGCDERFFREKKRDPSRFRVMTLGKSCQADNLPMVMDVCSRLRKTIPEIELYVHANVYDPGEYNLEIVRKRFDPEGAFIHFPDKFVSLVEGISTDELAEEYAKADVFVSIPLVSATSTSVWEAMAAGCIPLMSDCGSNRDLAIKLEKKMGTAEFSRERLLVPGIELMTVGETYLQVSDPEALADRLSWMHKNREKLEGYRGELAVFSQKDSKQAFMKDLVKVIETLEASNEVLCLETL
jgi:glycosyltransferase involved in cell wall biosynthesis